MLFVVVNLSVNMVSRDHKVLLVVVDLSVNMVSDEVIALFVRDVSMERINIAALFVLQVEKQPPLHLRLLRQGQRKRRKIVSKKMMNKQKPYYNGSVKAEQVGSVAPESP